MRRAPRSYQICVFPAHALCLAKGRLRSIRFRTTNHMKCKTCGQAAEGYKCDLCGEESSSHDANHSCGGGQCMPEWAGMGTRGSEGYGHPQIALSLCAQPTGAAGRG